MWETLKQFMKLRKLEKIERKNQRLMRKRISISAKQKDLVTEYETLKCECDKAHALK